MSKSEEYFLAANNYIPGGVNSPVRAFKAVGGTPLFIDHAKGAYLFDVDGNKYIDYVLSWGPMLLGHSHPEIQKAVSKQLTKGLSFGAPTQLETQLAEKLCSLTPNLEQVRMVNSGTEATMSAIRLARGSTGRDTIIKFEGCYHGHADSLLVKAGSGALTFGVPSSPGVPKSTAQHTLTLTYNDSEQVKQTFSDIGDSIAAVIVEPVAGNMNCIPPNDGFLETLRECCTAARALLIFDEVMTGFRLGPGGAQQRFSIDADLITLGKVIGGGMPVGAFGGKKEIMEQLAPLGPVYQAGTLSGNPVAMAAGIACINQIEKDDIYPLLFKKTTTLTSELQRLANKASIPFTTNHVGSMFGFFFTEAKDVKNYSQVMACNTQRFNQFFHAMLKEGVNFAPASYEASFMSIAHSDDDIQKTLAAAEKAFACL